MEPTNNSFFSDSLILLFNRACIIIANIVVMILFAYSLPQDTYGSFQSIWFQISTYSTIAGLGLSIFLYSYSFNKLKQLLNNIDTKYYVYFFIFILIVTSFFICTAAYSNTTLLPNKSHYIYWAIYFMAFAISLIFETLLIIALKHLKVLFFACIYTLMYILCAYLFTIEIVSLQLYITLLCIIATIKFIYLGILTYKYYKDTNVTKQNHNIGFQEVKKHWLQIGIFDILQFCFRNFDKLLISYIISKEIAAGYLNATYEIPIFALIFASIQNATLLQVNKFPNEVTKIATITYHSNTILGLFSIAILSVLFCYPTTFISLVFSSKYEHVSMLFLIALSKMPAYWFNLNTIFQVKERGDILNKGLLLDIGTTIVCMLVLFPIFKLEGLLVATIIGTYTQTIYNIYHFKKLSNSKISDFIPARNWIIYIFLFATINFILFNVLQQINNHSLANMIIQAIIVGTIMLYMLVKLFRKYNYSLK